MVAATCWLLGQAAETVAGHALGAALDWTGEAGWGIFFVGLGLALSVGGPAVMVLQNQKRAAMERPPRYHWVEVAVVVIGGLVFTAVGIGHLL